MPMKMLAPFIDKIADRVRWGYLTAFILLLVSYILTFYSSQQVTNQQKRVLHTTNVINTLDILSSEVIDAESSVRGYFITKDEIFLEDYKKAPGMVDSTLQQLKFLTTDNTKQQSRLDTLSILIKRKLDLLDGGIATFGRNNYSLTDSMVKKPYAGKIVMDEIQALVKKLQTEENDLMNKRSERVSALSNFIKVINIASIVIAIVLAFYSITTFNKENKAKQAADKQAEQFRQQLELRVEELATANNELLQLRSIEKFAATGRIARTIAHEVRNPLTNINLATEHLKTEIQSPEIEMLINMIGRNSNRINELINDLLNSTKATQLNFTNVNLNDLLDQSLTFAQDRIDLKEIKVVKKYASHLPQVSADIEKLNIAFLNIIVNAVEAMEPKEGVLTITTELKNNHCVVTISDNGKGIDDESLSKLFEPYFTTKEKGAGLGLTHTQNIILSHQANIIADSEPGQGTSFFISFNYIQ